MEGILLLRAFFSSISFSQKEILQMGEGFVAGVCLTNFSRAIKHIEMFVMFSHIVIFSKKICRFCQTSRLFFLLFQYDICLSSHEVRAFYGYNVRVLNGLGRSLTNMIMKVVYTV